MSQRTNELLEHVNAFYEARPEADCVDVMAELTTVAMVMVAASYPAEEQQKVFESWQAKLTETWGKVRAAVNHLPG